MGEVASGIYIKMGLAGWTTSASLRKMLKVHREISKVKGWNSSRRKILILFSGFLWQYYFLVSLGAAGRTLAATNRKRKTRVSRRRAGKRKR